MGTKRLTKSEVKKQSVLYSVATTICLCVATSVDDEFVKILFLGITFFLCFFSMYGWYLYSLSEAKFEQKTLELEKSETSSPSSCNTTDFNLYHSPDSPFSPHNDD